MHKTFETLNGHRGPLDATTDLARNPLSGITITVDGPTASGKGTLAKELARRYRLKFLDTGTIYRAVAYRMLSQSLDPTDTKLAEKTAKRLVFDFRHLGNNQFGTFVHGEDATSQIRTPEVGVAASIVAIQPPVRTALLTMQQEYVKHWQPLIGVVLDGRDTGARIAPTAQLKFFITADPAARAARRYKEFQATGKQITEAQTLADLIARDKRDEHNTLQCADAIVLDATSKNADQILADAIHALETKFGKIPTPVHPE